jgi:hypothetical protein
MLEGDGERPSRPSLPLLTTLAPTGSCEDALFALPGGDILLFGPGQVNEEVSLFLRRSGLRTIFCDVSKKEESSLC